MTTKPRRATTVLAPSKVAKAKTRIPGSATKNYADSLRKPVPMSKPAPKIVSAKPAPTPAPQKNGAEVRRLQTQLKAAGYNPGPIDGIWGAKTAAAYKAWQSKTPAKPAAAPAAKAPTGGGAGRAAAAPVSGGGVSGGASHAGHVDSPVGASPVGAPASAAPRGMDTKTLMDNARSAAEMELNPQLGELQRQLEMLTRGYTENANNAVSKSQRTDVELEELYKRLRGEQGAIQDQQRGRTQQAQSDVAGIYQQLQQGIGQTYDKGTGSVAAELQRLGLGSVEGAATEGMTRDKGFLQGLMGVNGANAQSNLVSQRDAFDQLMSSKQAGSEQEGASRRAQSQLSLQEALQEMMRIYEDERFGLQGKKSDLEATRGERLRQIAEQLSDKEYSRNMEQQQMQFQQEMARNNFGLEQRAFEQSLLPPMEQAPSYLDQLQAAKLKMEIENNMAVEKEKTMADKLREIFSRPPRIYARP